MVFTVSHFWEEHSRFHDRGHSPDRDDHSHRPHKFHLATHPVRRALAAAPTSTVVVVAILVAILAAALLEAYVTRGRRRGRPSV
jgi:hypothetical protein